MNELDKNARERALEKIRKLLALAKDNCNEHEAANAASQAEKMMRAYQVDSTDVILQELEHDEGFTREMSDVSFEGIKDYKSAQVPSWVGYIALGCGALFTCKVDIVSSAEKGVKVRFSGYSLDVSLCQWVYEFLCRTVYRLSKQETKGLGMSAAKSFRVGAGSTLQRRLIELKAMRDAENNNAPTGTGLVLFNRKARRVEEMFGATRTKSSRSSVGDRDAFAAGKNAAMKVGIPTDRPVGSSAPVGRLN